MIIYLPIRVLETKPVQRPKSRAGKAAESKHSTKILKASKERSELSDSDGENLTRDHSVSHKVGQRPRSRACKISKTLLNSDDDGLKQKSDSELVSHRNVTGMFIRVNILFI
jgi:hypothetical protein